MNETIQILKGFKTTKIEQKLLNKRINQSLIAHKCQGLFDLQITLICVYKEL